MVMLSNASCATNTITRGVEDIFGMDFVISVCWIVFVLYWGVSAIGTKKTAERLGIAALIKNRLPVILGVILLFAPTPKTYLRFLGVRIVPHDAALMIMADFFCLSGLAGAIWARRTIGGNWSGDVVIKENHTLVEYGPYRWVRHPIYTGMLLMMLGTAMATGHIGDILGWVLILCGLLVKLKQEESLMLSHFPDAYADYMSRVKRLIPYVY